MIDTLIIKRFKSLEDIRFDLQKINLFIGPNNSGKTNVLTSLTFLFNTLLFGIKSNLKENFRRYYFGVADENTSVFRKPISYIFITKKDKTFEYYVYEFWGLNDKKKVIKQEMMAEATERLPEDFSIHNWQTHKNIFTRLVIRTANNDKTFSFSISEIKNSNNNGELVFINDKISRTRTIPPQNAEQPLFNNAVDSVLGTTLKEIFHNIDIYSPDTNEIKKAHPLKTDKFISANAANLVSFLDNMRDEYPDIYENIKHDLTECLPEASDIRFRKVLIKEQITKQVGIANTTGQVFWADEVSEGTLYFLSLLAIIHQPKHPKLLLIEEPEKGIHPRRLHDIIHFIFKLADNKNIQIILTTHSPQVVNEFEDFPESVFVFDTENGKTRVKNLLKNIIEHSNKKSNDSNLPKIDYTNSLGENWVFGFLGGVPK